MSIATTREGVLLLVRGRRFVSSRRRRGHRQHRVGPHPQHEEHEEQLQLGESSGRNLFDHIYYRQGAHGGREPGLG